MIRRPPRSTLDRSSAASDVYKRQVDGWAAPSLSVGGGVVWPQSVSYTHLRAHETPEHLVCRLLLEKKKQKTKNAVMMIASESTRFQVMWISPILNAAPCG